MIRAVIVIGATSLTGVVTVLFFVMDMVGDFHIHKVRYTYLLTIFSLVCVIASTSSYFIIEKIGRITIIKIGTIGMGLTNIGMALGMFFRFHYLSFTMLNLYFWFYLISMGTVKWVYIGEIGSMQVAFACYISYWVCNLIAVILWPILLDYMYIEWFIFAVLSFLVWGIMWKMVETNTVDDSSFDTQRQDESFFDVIDI